MSPDEKFIEIPIPSTIQATCPTHGKVIFYRADHKALGSTADWWVCQEWVHTPEYAHAMCRYCIFWEDVDWDGATVRDYERVLIGIMGLGWSEAWVRNGTDYEDWVARSKMMAEAWEGTRPPPDPDEMTSDDRRRSLGTPPLRGAARPTINDPEADRE